MAALRRSPRRRGRHNDCIERRLGSQADHAVGVFQANVRQPQWTQVAFGSFEQRRDALDGVYITGKLRQHGGLVTAPGSDFKRLAERTSASAQKFNHARDDKGLRNGLLEAERQRSVLVGPRAERLFDELMARNGLHCRQHALVADA